MVPDATVETWLELAARRHTASAFGDVYGEAMVAWAASRIEPLRIAGQAGELGHDGKLCGPMTRPDGTPLTPPKPEATVYWSWYLDYRDSRVAAAPRAVSACG
jgi:hypothetical protein